MMIQVITAATLLLLTTSSAQPSPLSGTTPAHTPSPTTPAKLFTSIQLQCESYGAPISHCLWERREKPILITFDASIRPGQSSSVPGYTYTGLGLDRGICGLEISSVRDEDDGVWDCTLIAGSRGVFRGSVRVGLLKKPTPPQFTPTVSQLTNLIDPSEPGAKSNGVTVTCGSADGQPPPKFRWFIGTRELTPSDGLQPYLSSNQSGHSVTTQSLENYPFSWRDNGKLLKCVAEHDGYTSGDRTEVGQIVSVSFTPRADAPPVTATPGSPLQLTLNISAHPRPTVHWEIGEQVLQQGGSIGGRMKLGYVQEVEPGLFETKLTIDPVEEDDFRTIFTVKAENERGLGSFAMRIGSTEEATEAGLGAGGIIGLVLGIPALLILIAVLLVYTRARGLLCFRVGGSGEEDVEHGKRTESVDEKPAAAAKLTTRLSALYENLMAAAAQKRKSAAPAEEKAPPPPEPTSQPPTATPTKSTDDIVYAELTLDGPKGQSVVVKTDGTEYAEIVGVVKQ